MPCFYEFFAGGGMARAGLGKTWDCLLANDIDEKKAASYAANWGDKSLKITSVGNPEALGRPWTLRFGLGIVPLSGLVLSRFLRRTKG
jgi:site-specific DNA-cytosine methylase